MIDVNRTNKWIEDINRDGPEFQWPSVPKNRKKGKWLDTDDCGGYGLCNIGDLCTNKSKTYSYETPVPS